MQTILVADDEPEVRDYLAVALNCGGYDVKLVSDGEEVLSCLQQRSRDFSLVLLDLIMPRRAGLETLEVVRREWPNLPVITLSGCCSPADVASALKRGAVDFFPKPIEHEALLSAIRNTLESRLTIGHTTAPGGRKLSSEFVSDSAWSRQVETLLNYVGSSDSPVLLRGETGVGKEVLARRLHAGSRRATGPFLKLNCAALPFELVESELFGYEKGAFTGAFRSTPGKFELANKGTIVLDEIGDMDFRLQAKLLQVLQDREFIRLGGKETCQVDVRIMAATHCDLETAIIERRFREDLYYRLNILEIRIPPLRERMDEVVPLAQHFLKRYAPAGEVPELPRRLQEALTEHLWPGNVRELENVIRKFLVFRSADMIVQELRYKQMGSKGVAFYAASSSRLPDLPTAEIKPSSPNTNGRAASTFDQLEQARRANEADVILDALNASMWNRKQAAKTLNLHYKALLYKMKKLGIGEIDSNLSPDSK